MNKTNFILVISIISIIFVAGCKDKEEVIPIAIITNISDTYGLRGSTLTITGSDFHGSAVVYIGDIVATIVSIDAMTIVVTIPTDAVTGDISIMQGGKSTFGPSYHVYTPAKNLFFTQFFEKIDLVNNPSQSVTLYDDSDGIAAPVAIVLSNNGFLYVTGYYSSEIYKMPNDGSGSAMALYDYEDGVDGPTALDVDNENGMLYWANSPTHQFMKGPVDGNEEPFALFNGDEFFLDCYGLKLDVDSDEMYFSDEEIKKVKISGNGTPDVLYGSAGLTEMSVPSNIVIDKVRGKLYWTDEGSAQIVEASMDGSGTPVVLFDGDDGLLYPVGLDVDYASGLIYWTDDNHGKIFKGNLDGTGAPVEVADAENSYGMILEFEGNEISWK